MKQIDRELSRLSKEFSALPAFPEGRERRRQIRAEIRDLNQERYELAWGPANRG